MKSYPAVLSRSSWRCMIARVENGTGLPFEKYMSERHQAVPGAHGRTRNVAGSGTRITSGNPVISGMSNPPPATNTGVNRWFVVSMTIVAPEKSMPLSKAETKSCAERNFPRGIPCWSAQAIRTVLIPSRSSRSLTSPAAFRWSLPRRPNSSTNPRLPTLTTSLSPDPIASSAQRVWWPCGANRGLSGRLPDGRAGSLSGCAFPRWADFVHPVQHLPRPFRPVEQQVEQRQVVGVDLGRGDLGAVQRETPEGVLRIPPVREQRAVARQEPEVRLPSEPPMDLRERLLRGGSLRHQVGQDDEAHLAVGPALQPVFVGGPDLRVPFEQPVVAEGERPRPALLGGVDEWLGVGELNRGEPIGPPEMDQEPGRSDLGERPGPLRILLQAGRMAIAAHGRGRGSRFAVQPGHSPAVPRDADPFEPAGPGKDPAERLGSV